MITVLLVEDSLTETEVLSAYLKQAGVTVVSVTSGEEAQIKLQSQKPDLVILDVILPGQSGFELCRELKTNANTQGIPVVICSTKGTDADKLWGSMLGADAYIPKPVDQKKLMQTIQQLTSIY
jgi:DNA-binding response OmpR family regulator